VAQALLAEFTEAELEDIGPLSINVSGCMNACGHHHVGHIGVLGVDKNGEEWFQVTIGGRQGNDTRLGKVIGPAFRAEDMPRVARTLVETYRARRAPGETFLDTLDRLGPAPFKEAVYAGTPAARHHALQEAADVDA
jgi:sulfite reductase (NADPH) hemoprotein beta-component